MGLVAVILVAFSLCFDTLAVSVACSCMLKKVYLKNALKIALTFAIFQAIMPLIGYFIGINLNRLTFIAKMDHWLAFGLLFIVGAKMIWESFKPDGKSEKFNPLSFPVLFTMAFATSIDALATGISFAFAMSISIWVAVLIIFLVTLAVSLVGLFSGCGFKKYLGNKVEIIGGIVLILIGVKILVEHLLE